MISTIHVDDTRTIQTTSKVQRACGDFGDMTPHTLVGGAQINLTATASARADRRDWPSAAWGPRDKTHTPPLGALDRRTGATGAVGMAHNILVVSETTGVGKGLTYFLDSSFGSAHGRGPGRGRSS